MFGANRFFEMKLHWKVFELLDIFYQVSLLELELIHLGWVHVRNALENEQLVCVLMTHTHVLSTDHSESIVVIRFLQSYYFVPFFTIRHF